MTKIAGKSTTLTKRKHSNLLVKALVGENLVDAWWNGRNRAFNGLTPNEQWGINPEVVYSYLLSHAYGGEYG